MSPAVELLELSALGLEDTARVGAKAAVLGALLRRGLPVPPGFALADPMRWADEMEANGQLASSAQLPPADLSGLPTAEGPRWIARSSATVEDGASASFAGQLESIGGLATRAELLAAVRRVGEPNERARAYARSRGLDLGACIPVLVQRQIAAVRSGVLFTVDPQGVHRRSFALDWGAAGEVTDGCAESRLLTFDPLDPGALRCDDPVVARALPRLVELAFGAIAALGAEGPLDLEWLIDVDERVWIVQARPVTACVALPQPEVRRLLDRGFDLASPRPASRLGIWSFGVAAGVDRRAALFHHGWFDRQTAGPWLLTKRVKRHGRQAIVARTPAGFLFAWLRARFGNLCFGLGMLPAWRRASSKTDRLAEQVLAADLRRLSVRRLRRLVDEALALHGAVRRVHAGLWYPIDLVKDLAAFEEQHGPVGLSAALPQPSRRSLRDRKTAELVLAIRERNGGEHLPWAWLDPAARAQIERHLVQFPYAFESRVEVQDPAAWRAWIERPEAWWSQQSPCAREDLERQSAAPPHSTPPQARLAGKLLRAAVGTFTPLKDDRVELLAKAGAVLRAVLLEAERRAAGAELDEGWVFELELAELKRLGAALEQPAEVGRLRERAVGRLHERVLEGFAACGQAEQAPAPEASPAGPQGGLELRGGALARGLATGRAFPAASASEAQRLRPGEVLVVEELRPAFTAALPRAAALVCQRGSPLSHGAIIARELGIPAVQLDDLAPLRSGVEVTVDGRRGVVGISVAEG